jgi:uncharacterized protein YraI
MWRRIIILLLALTALVVSTAPALAQNGAVWNGAYYNNSFLSGAPAFSRQDGALAFDWGGGSPGSSVGNDNFSVRWGTDIVLSAGTYRFWALADDNIRITVNFDFHPVIDTFANRAVGQTVSGDVTLPGGSTHIQVDYQEASGNAFAYITWANLATNPGGPNFPSPVQPPPVSGGQWTAQYYTNPNLSGSPTLIQSESSPTHYWGSGSPASGIPADNFSTRWTSVQSLTGGTYRISVKADDGVRAYVNGSLVINEFHGATGQTYTADVSLPAGQHNFMIEYYEGGGDAFLEYNLSQIGVTTPPIVVPPPISPSGSWLAYYFNNPNLSGSPTAIISEASPSHNWGSGSPLPSISADNFSVRWTSNLSLNAGTYRISTKADDGVRVYVNGSLVINEFHSATGQTYVADVTLPGGQHTFTIEYYEASVAALLEFSLGSPTAPSPPNPTGATARVTAYRLNVRNIPTASNSTILLKINQNETYPVVGRTQDSSWWQINVNGTVGWVYGTFVRVSNANSVPVTSGSGGGGSIGSPTGYSVTATTNVNLRSGPGTNNGVLAVIRQNTVVPVIGRNASATWWQVNYNGIVGWTSANFAVIQAGTDLSRIPVTG